VCERLAAELRQRSEARALSQYVRVVAGNAEIEGVELEAAASPLVQ
jgi:peptidyl-prolyl cis-trans isomerase C